jgi:hypothetical protein
LSLKFIFIFIFKISSSHSASSRTAGSNVTKRAGRVEHNRNRTTAGHYNIKNVQTSTTRKRQHQHAGGENEEQQGQT